MLQFDSLLTHALILQMRTVFLKKTTLKTQTQESSDFTLETLMKQSVQETGLMMMSQMILMMILSSPPLLLRL